MKVNTSFVALAMLAGEASAFPAAFKAMVAGNAAKRATSSASEARSDLHPRVPGFNAEQQYVSNTGAHAFVAPGSLDARGPCPGLNAMANHNYIPHNGVATIAEFINGTYEVFGMGTDLGTFLATYGAVIDGDLTSWSIGGPTAALPLGLGGLLGQPDGLVGSHNKYEADVSPTRGDLYEVGNDYLLQLPQFNDMYNLPLGPNGYDLSVLTPFRADRFQQSVSMNPYFFNGPFSGIGVQPAAYTFTYRFMSNKSAEYPEGYLDGDVLKSFHSITGDPGSFTYTPGYEAIPDNWYKRAIGDEYTIPYFLVDLVAAATQYPEFLDVGGNTGTTNSFTGVDIADLTGGVYNAQNLLEGDNALCFSYQFAQQAMPDLLKGLYSVITDALSEVNTAFDNALSELSCPQLESVDTSQLQQFPGYTQSYDGYSEGSGGL